jgi:exosome complex exonuclease DIS3/RRP44
LGIEGLVSFKNDQQFDAENYSLSIAKPDSTIPVTVSVFDKVTVRVEVEKDKNTQRGRVKMTLVSPVDTKEM